MLSVNGFIIIGFLWLIVSSLMAFAFGYLVGKDREITKQREEKRLKRERRAIKASLVDEDGYDLDDVDEDDS